MMSQETEVVEIMRILRIEISGYLDYEDVGVMVNDKFSGSLMALSPNLSLTSVKNQKKLSPFFYSPDSCISVNFLKSNKKIQVVLSPRDNPHFLEGVDNLSPVLSIDFRLLQFPISCILDWTQEKRTSASCS